MNCNVNSENTISSISNKKLLKEHIDSLKKTIDDLNLKITYPFEFQESIRKFNANGSRKIFSHSNSSIMIQSNDCRAFCRIYDESVGVILSSDLCLYIKINNDDGMAGAWEKYITEAFHVFKSSYMCNAESLVMKVNNNPYQEYRTIVFEFCENTYYLDKKLFYEFLTFEKSLFDFYDVLSDIIAKVDIFERFIRSISYEKSPDYLQKIGKTLNTQSVQFVNYTGVTTMITKLQNRFNCIIDAHIPHFNSEIIKISSIESASPDTIKYGDDVYSLICTPSYIIIELKNPCLIFKHITKEMSKYIYQCVCKDGSLTYHSDNNHEAFITYRRMYYIKSFYTKSLDEITGNIETDCERDVRDFLERLLNFQ